MTSNTKEEKEKMGNVAHFQNGGGYNRDEFSENGVPVVRVSDFTGDSIDLSECKYLPEDYPDEYEKYNLRREDVLVSTVGSWPGKSKSSVGKVIKVPKRAEGCLLNQNIVRLRKRDGKTNQRYLFYLAKSKPFQRHIANNARGSANHARVAISMLEEFEFKFPPLPVQRRIADILGALDDKIELNRRMNETLEKMAQTLYRHWFVNFGPFQDREFKDTEELGAIPKGWDVKPIKEVVDMLGGSTPKTKVDEYWDDGNVTWFTPTDLTDQNQLFLEHSDRRITEEGLNSCSTNLFPPYSIMMTSRATVGVTAINRVEACTNQGFINIIPGDEVSLPQVYFWIDRMMHKIEARADGSTRTRLMPRPGGRGGIRQSEGASMAASDCEWLCSAFGKQVSSGGREGSYAGRKRLPTDKQLFR